MPAVRRRERPAPGELSCPGCCVRLHPDRWRESNLRPRPGKEVHSRKPSPLESEWAGEPQIGCEEKSLAWLLHGLGRRLMSPRLIYRQGSGKGYCVPRRASAADDLYMPELWVPHVLWFNGLGPLRYRISLTWTIQLLQLC